MKRVWWWSRSHIVDYVLVLGLLGVCGVVDLGVDPYRGDLPFASTNPDVAYPYVASTVPSWSAGVLAYGCPGFAFFAAHAPYALLGSARGTQLLGRGVTGDGACWSSVGHELHHAALALAEAATLNSLVTGVAKDFAGRYRPHYVALEQMARAANNTAIEREGRKSFPSGHSSTAFCGMTLLALWLAGKLRVFSSRAGGVGRGQFWAVCVVAIPEVAAFLVAISRVRDYHHNYSDIVAGGIIGLLTATVAYHTLFHSPLGGHSGLPKSRVAADSAAIDDPLSKPLQPSRAATVEDV